jgi:hypothetical protein
MCTTCDGKQPVSNINKTEIKNIKMDKKELYIQLMTLAKEFNKAV